MGVSYQSILWNRHKKKYDLLLWAGIIIVGVIFSAAQLILHSTITVETIIIRATAFIAILLLHLILAIGPLCRIDKRFLPMLYNRRHLGVSMFLLAFVHGVFSIIQFHVLGDVNPILSIFTSNQNYQEISEFPFQVLGFFALLIFLLMAATSHDFWLHHLTPRLWKSLHMMVYVAYGLVIAHVALGTLQYEDHPLYWVLLTSGFITLAGLHLYTGVREIRQLQHRQMALEQDGFLAVCGIDEIPEKCAKIIFVNGENIAIFKYDEKLSAVNNICRHQMGPLGEGKIIDGCITCPWHGYQYLPENGQSPPPFQEKIKTYQVKVLEQQIWINPSPFAAGTNVIPAHINSESR
jgi:nitrite reductase/ring-hydroxylating ferredoxin subunit